MYCMIVHLVRCLRFTVCRFVHTYNCFMCVFLWLSIPVCIYSMCTFNCVYISHRARDENGKPINIIVKDKHLLSISCANNPKEDEEKRPHCNCQAFSCYIKHLADGYTSEHSPSCWATEGFVSFTSLMFSTCPHEAHAVGTSSHLLVCLSQTSLKYVIYESSCWVNLG